MCLCALFFSTAKYSFFTFFVKFPFEQFRRYANCFFLFIALMQVGAHYSFQFLMRLIDIGICKRTGQ